jgi:2-polyprenyl-3-methyl-5-hydroxy-6-metoxy-1,4-benzoquinol methylase
MRWREHVPELMDDPGLDRRAHEEALCGLERIHRLSRSVAVLWEPIAAVARSAGGESIRVLDLACGGGSVAGGIARRAKSAGLPIEVHGADLSTQALEFAEAQVRAEGLGVRFFRLDAVAGPLPEGYDVLLCTLFLHHLSADDAARLLGRMAAAARRLVLVDDLVRGRVGYVLAWAGCHLVTRSRIVHHDGPTSVACAFRVEEVRAMAEEQGLSGVTIRTHWPERFLLSWSRP